MRRFRRSTTRDASRRRIWVYLAVGLFLVCDAYLVTTALTSTRADTGLPAATPRAILAPSATPTPSPTASAAAAVSPVPATRILSAVSSTVAWRAVTGICPDPLAAPEVSTDAGATWTTTDANGPTEVTALQSIAATNGSVAQFLGFSESDCSAQVVRTFVGGDNYSSADDELDTAWYVDPVDRSELHGPDGFHPAPCDTVVALAPGFADADADAAAVLCADARVFATTDAAASWSAPLTVPGALTLTATTGGYIAMAAGAATSSAEQTATPAATADPATCLGLSVIDLSIDPAGEIAGETAGDAAADLTAATAGCYVTADAPATLAGNIAVASADGTLWLWIGDATLRSTDAGRTWL
ncbi:hypothetical protein RCH23_002455 [Cryobacterium sp. CAN_C3]|uniref:hypothetical protein n=1 Tax=unclassified Cryobacterium TaxID=2649013 RepID=UPI0018CB07D0|nr:hypothetical protein [Cryobacterium sp. CAN_C3]MEC5155063.1 hypothetical protein [Cryobacterium sp. CAN_C3]